MAGIWVRAGTVTLTNGSKKVTGSGTAWNSGTNKVTKGCAFIYNNIAYEVDYINSDTELYLVDTYSGTTGSGLSYRIQIAVTDTIPELASRIATALAYWNGQAANLQALTTGSGNVTLTAPDGTQVVVPAYSSMQPKDTLLTALAALTTEADKLVYFTGSDTVNQTTLTSFARTLLDDIDAATARTTLGAQASDATLTALAAVVTAADKLIYATGADTFATATLTSFARKLLSCATSTEVLDTLYEFHEELTATLMFAMTQGSVANQSVKALKEQIQQEGEITLTNRGVITGCTITKSTTAARNLNLVGGSAFMSGRRYLAPSKDNTAIVPPNTTAANVTVKAYLYFNAASQVMRLAVTNIGDALPVDAIHLYNITIPPASTDATDPYLNNVTLTSVRRVESSFPRLLDNPAITTISINTLRAADYRLDFDVVSFSGGQCDPDNIAIQSRATNGFTLALASDADNVVVRWKASKLNN